MDETYISYAKPGGEPIYRKIQQHVLRRLMRLALAQLNHLQERRGNFSSLDRQVRNLCLEVLNEIR